MLRHSIPRVDRLPLPWVLFTQAHLLTDVGNEKREKSSFRGSVLWWCSRSSVNKTHYFFYSRTKNKAVKPKLPRDRFHSASGLCSVRPPAPTFSIFQSLPWPVRYRGILHQSHDNLIPTCRNTFVHTIKPTHTTSQSSQLQQSPMCQGNTLPAQPRAALQGKTLHIPHAHDFGLTTLLS